MSFPAGRVGNRAPSASVLRVIALLAGVHGLTSRQVACGLGRTTDASVQSIRVQLRTAVRRGLLSVEGPARPGCRGQICFYTLSPLAHLFTPGRRTVTTRPERHLVTLCEAAIAVLREPALRTMNVAPAGQYTPLERAA